MNKRDQVVEIIKNIFFVGKEYDLSDTKSFFDAGVFDSIGMMDLISEIEKTFNITLNEDELMPENLESVDAIVGFLKSKEDKI